MCRYFAFGILHPLNDFEELPKSIGVVVDVFAVLHHPESLDGSSSD